MNDNLKKRIARPARSMSIIKLTIISLTIFLHLNLLASAQQLQQQQRLLQQESQTSDNNVTFGQEVNRTLQTIASSGQDYLTTNQSSIPQTPITPQLSSSKPTSNLLLNKTRLTLRTDSVNNQQVVSSEIPIVDINNNETRNSNISFQQANHSDTQPQQPSVSKSAPILRPSIEEVASELSKKYLNLDRHKNPPVSVAQDQHPVDQTTPPLTIQTEKNVKFGETAGNHAEQEDIVLQLPYPLQQQQSKSDRANSSATKRDNVSSSPRLAGELALTDVHYLHVDTIAATANAAISARSRNNNNSRASRTNRYSSKRRANNDLRLAYLQERPNEDDELSQCQQYLYQHSAAYQAAAANSAPTSDSSGYGRVFSSLHSASHSLPCSCESGWHFATGSSLELDSNLTNSLKGFESRVWLNCDNVQLIGSQLFTPHYNQQSNYTHDGKFADISADNYQTNALITQFSQRDADIQVLFSQKFHYLQMSSLKSIDLSGNRLRTIKIDAFHGLENGLEFLNLANNLLGDARAMFASEFQSTPKTQASVTSANDGGAAAGQNSGKSVFISDELNKLRSLKWLSLKNNQINQLSSNIFVRHQSIGATGPANQHITIGTNQANSIGANGQATVSETAAPTSELLYLDLSYNLLKAVPSDSIQQLNKLSVLKLHNNKITHLDQVSKFPHSLKYLDLSYNLINTIRHCDLIDLPELIELNLSNNQLRHLDQLAFVSVNSLITQAPVITSLQVGQSDRQAQGDVGSGSVERDTSHLISPAAGVVQRVQYLDQDNKNQYPRQSRQIRDTKSVQAENEDEVLEAVETSLSESEQDNDLDAEESLLSALSNKLNREKQATLSEELIAARPSKQFNSTLKLNLSRNFFEIIPGDSLLKFTSLQSLDLSHNRIRYLDSNYLCSIYNLVDNLRYLDLSGNLIHLDQQQGASYHGQLNKLFGCLLKLEKLLLSTNRLAVSGNARNQEEKSNGHEQEIDFSRTGANSQPSASEDSKEVPLLSQDVRLSFRFGESFGSKYLNTLDLSDNRLKSFPIIEQVIEQPPASIFNSNTTGVAISLDQTQMNQWMSHRSYLEVLNLNYNFIERIGGHELDHLYNLRQLHLDYNKLLALPVDLMRKFTSLDQLSLAGNRLASLDPLNELLERSMKTLRVLNLANNRLLDWPPLSDRLFQNSNTNNNMNSQQYVSSQDPNRLMAGGANPDDHSAKQSSMIEFALEDLNLEGNLLTSVNATSLFDQLIYMKSLKVLNLNYNLLNKIRSDWFKFASNLQRLLLRGNKINNIDLGAFSMSQVSHLIQLDLDYNLLKELKRKTFDSMPKIRELNLAHNLIHTINSETFHQLNSLHVLKLNNNKLTSWKCEYFSYLCNSISGNINVDLATLISPSHGQSLISQQQQSQNLHHQQQPPTSTGSGAISSLIELDLSHNSLSQLRANSISVHSKLVRLNLAHNKLSFIPHDLFKATTSMLNGDRQVHLISSLKYLNLAHNRIQTIDNINFKPLKNLLALDLSFNELQTLGTDVVTRDTNRAQQDSSQRRVIVSNNLTNLLVDNDTPQYHQHLNQTRLARSLYYSTSSWPALTKLRHLNLAHNSLTMINQSLLSELSPFVALNLNLSFNYLDSELLPVGFFTKISSASLGRSTVQQNDGQPNSKQSYDLVFTMKLESLDLSHNRLSEWPGTLLDNHYSSMESCNLSHNRIQNLPQNSNSMIQIRALNFEFNPLSRESNELLLTEQRSLRYLNLAATRLYAIQQATADSAQYLRSVSNLKLRLVNQTSRLDLIRSISKPIEAPYLRHLNLSSNQLVWLSANVFDKLHSLQTLDLSNNQLTRLHLLSNQLNQVSPTLAYLNVASNLFTSIDMTDFSQLSRLRHLDMSNLLSLQKLDCRFLNKLTTLTHLKMFNYPQLRHKINNLIKTYRSDDLTEKYQQKIQDELMLSTIGGHCFKDATMFPISGAQADGESPTSNILHYGQNWFKLEQIELELFNNFANLDDSAPDSFELQDELKQLLGPTTKKLSLFGLNLTSISDSSLVGITNEDLDLRISYTSISQLPLRQILSSLAKRTKLKLDLRNNNIQLIDVDALQWLDELQQINMVSSQSHINDEPYSPFSLKLASNPFRCDCQTRPLWLWLNQRWDNVELPQISDELIGETSTGNNANYWLKFHTISHTTDLKCFHPLKLRGKLAQHVYYNDLVCRGSAHPSSVPSTPARQLRKSNETTKSSDSYYQTSLNDSSDDLDDLEDNDYADISSDLPATKAHKIVRVTRFNRYPSAINNSTSLYFLNNFPSVPFIPDTHELSDTDYNTPPGVYNSHLGKRDHNSAPTSVASSTSGSGFQTDPPFNTKYSKHRPNTHQKHSHFYTMTNLNNAQFGRGDSSRVHRDLSPGASSQQNHPAKHSVLTDSDIMILTVASVAMIIMSLIIISVCLFKYKLDHADHEHILSTHSKLVMSHALLSDKSNVLSSQSNHTSARTSSSRSSSSKKSSSNVRGSLSMHGHSKTSNHGSKYQSTSAKKLELSKLNTAISKPNPHLGPPNYHVVAPISIAQQRPLFLAPAAQNFLMRSPTIRRMHGLANNASDWFKYTLRAYPTNTGSRRRRLFIQNSAISGPSQLNTATLANCYNNKQLQQQELHQQDKFLYNSLILSGCPFHEFKCLNEISGVASGGEKLQCVDQCLYCGQLLIAMQQTKAEYPFGRVTNLSETTKKSGTPADSKEGCKSDVDEPKIDREQAIASSSRAEGGNMTFQATIERNGGFMPPKMIQALAKRLDERHGIIDEMNHKIHKKGHGVNHEQQQSSCSSSHNVRLSSSFHSRDQQKRSMRTFGYNGEQQAMNAQSSDKTNSESNQSAGDVAATQIPTIDVEGRFTYQSDSQIGSPYATSRALDYNSRTSTHGRTTPASTVATGHEDIFILVRDTPTSEATRDSIDGRSQISRHLGCGSGLVGCDLNKARSDDYQSSTSYEPNVVAHAEEMGSSTMNDECSRTSSPIAYGFMRSSPSATTLSSNTMTTYQNHYTINRSPEIASLVRANRLQPVNRSSGDQSLQERLQARPPEDPDQSGKDERQQAVIGVKAFNENCSDANNNTNDPHTGKTRPNYFKHDNGKHANSRQQAETHRWVEQGGGNTSGGLAEVSYDGQMIISRL